jgi:hypothetical protein
MPDQILDSNDPSLGRSLPSTRPARPVGTGMFDSLPFRIGFVLWLRSLL